MYNNLDIKRDKDDLKFIPLNIMEPFTDKNSSWFPNINLTLPTFNNIPDGFVLGFTSPIDNSNLQGTSLKTLDFMQDNDLNIQNSQNKKQFEEDFDLYYPSETLGEELFSYNKDDKCKSNNSSMNTQKQGTYKNPNINLQSGNTNNQNPNMNLQNGNTNNQNPNVNLQNGNINNQSTNMNGQNTNMNIPIMQNRSSSFQEPIHMELLRSLDFEDYVGGGFRGEKNNLNDIENIFKIIKDDESIIDTFKAYNIPKPIHEMIIKKIIIITLENSKYKRGE